MAGPDPTEDVAQAPKSLLLPWWIAFSFLSLLAIMLLWLPVRRMQAHYEINYNEGWNAYVQQLAANGIPLYGAPPAYTRIYYPPLSFHLIGWLGTLMHSMMLAGRLTAVLSLVAIALLLAAMVRRQTDSWRYGVYSALCIVIWIAAYKPDRIGMNDPHLLGSVFSLLGFYCFLRRPESNRWLCCSAVAFAFSLFTKHSLLAFPCAAGIQLLLTSKRHLAVWLGAAASAGVILLLLTLGVDGRHFFEHLMLPRTYTFGLFLYNVSWYSIFFQVPIVVALVWSFWNAASPRNSVLVWAFVSAHAFAFLFTPGDGTDWNHLFEPMFCLALIGAVALHDVEWVVQRVRLKSVFLTALLLAPFFLGSLVILPPRLKSDREALKGLPRLEQEHTAAVEFLKSRPGPALCESLLLCYDAGKPMTFDAFAVDSLVKTRRIYEDDVLVMLRKRHWTTIEIYFGANERLQASARLRFSEAFMRELFRDYLPALRTSEYALFIPIQ
jgi:uncharacterized membrane protein YhaH (DUF805 family)